MQRTIILFFLQAAQVGFMGLDRFTQSNVPVIERYRLIQILLGFAATLVNSISLWIMRSTLSSRVSFPCLLKLIRTLYFVFPIRLVTVQLPGLLDSWFLIIMQLLCYMVDSCFDWDCDAVPLPVSGQHSIQAIMCSLIAS